MVHECICIVKMVMVWRTSGGGCMVDERLFFLLIMDVLLLTLSGSGFLLHFAQQGRQHNILFKLAQHPCLQHNYILQCVIYVLQHNYILQCTIHIFYKHTHFFGGSLRILSLLSAQFSSLSFLNFGKHPLDLLLSDTLFPLQHIFSQHFCGFSFSMLC